MGNIDQHKEKVWGDTVSKIKWTSEQIKVLQNIKVDFDVTDELNDDQIIELDEKVTHFFVMNGIGANDTVTPVGRICESIIDAISDL